MRLEVLFAGEAIGAGAFARRALLRWALWPASLAFAAWLESARDAARERQLAALALRFLLQDASSKVTCERVVEGGQASRGCQSGAARLLFCIHPPGAVAAAAAAQSP